MATISLDQVRKVAAVVAQPHPNMWATSKIRAAAKFFQGRIEEVRFFEPVISRDPSKRSIRWMPYRHSIRDEFTAITEFYGDGLISTTQAPFGYRFLHPRAIQGVCR